MDVPYFPNRYYDSSTGRYLTPDPIGFKGGINLFVYIENNPIIRIDPSGFGPRGAAIGATVGGIIGTIAAIGETAGTWGGGAIIAPEIIGGSIIIGAAIGSYMEDNWDKLFPPISIPTTNTKDECPKKRCKPCIPPLGTVGFEIHTNDIRGAHKGMDHVKLRTMRQHPVGTPSPYECQCYWSKPTYLSNTTTPPTGSVPWCPAGGGGVEYY